MTRYIKHITLNTGHIRQSPRDEVQDVVINVLRPILREAVETHQRVPLQPGPPNLSLQATSGGQHLMVTIWDEQLGHPLITLTVATRSRGASGLWTMIHKGREGLVTDPLVTPLAPWCGVIIEPAFLHRPDAAIWAGDLERCLAWTWMEERHGD